jgi:hypothetical protein
MVHPSKGCLIKLDNFIYSVFNKIEDDKIKEIQEVRNTAWHLVLDHYEETIDGGAETVDIGMPPMIESLYYEFKTDLDALPVKGNLEQMVNSVTTKLDSGAYKTTYEVADKFRNAVNKVLYDKGITE